MSCFTVQLLQRLLSEVSFKSEATLTEVTLSLSHSFSYTLTYSLTQTHSQPPKYVTHLKSTEFGTQPRLLHVSLSLFACLSLSVSHL